MKEEKVWFRVSEYDEYDRPISFYTVYYCPDCGVQRTFHSFGFMTYKCDVCGCIMKYEKQDKLLRKIRSG